MTEKEPVVADVLTDPWAVLRRATRARIGLGRAGDGLPTRALLDFQEAHAAARDAVHAPFDAEGVAAAVTAQTGLPVLHLASRAADRAAYLQRPDLGRLPDPADLARLPSGGSYDAAFVIADGLSAAAVHAHAVALLRETLARLPKAWRIAPVAAARQARVALGDSIGERLGAAMVAVLIGERPGLSAADSLGVYLTFAPRPGRVDSERNCISNIRPPDGLDYGAAAAQLAALMTAARTLGKTGVELKIEPTEKLRLS
jgi:ethanolamine ammonia-lyase small subunit